MSTTVPDACGRRVPAVSLRALSRGDDRGAARDDRRRSLVRRIGKKTRETAWSIAGAIMIWVVLAVVIWRQIENAHLPRNWGAGWPRGVAVIALFGVIAALTWWLATRKMSVRRAAMAAEAGFCGSCGYELAGLTPSPHGGGLRERTSVAANLPTDDQIITCSECGSAWRRNDCPRVHCSCTRESRSASTPLLARGEP